MQQSIGNQAVQRLFREAAIAPPLDGPLLREREPRPTVIDPAPTGQVQRKKHYTGKEVDAYIEATPFIQKWVASKVKKGVKAGGAVTIYKAAAFDKAVVKYLMKCQNPDTGEKYTKSEAIDFSANVNAYQDSGKIYIHEDRGAATTTIHESMHIYEDSNALDLGFNVSEGMTEYFTRLLCKKQKLTRSGFYDDQYTSVKKLVKQTSQNKVAAAYFGGNVEGLRKAVDAKFEGKFDQWVKYMKAGDYTRADAYM